jgi:short-subunit dehydrogenase
VAAALPGSGHVALAADVGDAAAVRAAIECFGEVDVCVANAGVSHYRPLLELAPAEIDEMTAINWQGTVSTVAAALPSMVARRCGHVVVISSAAALRSLPAAGVYGATKAAQHAFAEALRHELAGTGVSVTTVFPGQIATGLHDHETDRMPAWYPTKAGAPAAPLAEAVVAAVQTDRRELYHPSNVRLLRLLNGIAPKAADVLVRRLLGPSAAPRRG